MSSVLLTFNDLYKHFAQHGAELVDSETTVGDHSTAWTDADQERGDKSYVSIVLIARPLVHFSARARRAWQRSALRELRERGPLAGVWRPVLLPFRSPSRRFSAVVVRPS